MPPRLRLWCGLLLGTPGTSSPVRIVADFLIGAHAQFQADALLMRDRGFFGSRFKGLRLIDPTHP